MAGKSQKSSSSSSSSASTSPAPAAEGYEQPYGNAAVQDECQAHGSEETPDNEVGAARAGAPTSFSEAIARHEENRGIVDRLIRSALEIEVDPIAGADSRANLLRNTAQWIDEGEADLYVLTPVHDAEKRPGCPGDHNAYFDKSKMYDQVGSTYDPTLNAAGEAVNDAGLEFKRPRVAGSMAQDGRRMTLVDPGKRTESQLVGFFVHEVQHDCDQHRGGESWEVERPDRDPNAIRRAPQWTYNSFQSEFRAYWMMNPEGSSVDTKGSSTDGGVTNFSVTAVAPGTDGLVRTADDVSNTACFALPAKGVAPHCASGCWPPYRNTVALYCANVEDAAATGDDDTAITATATSSARSQDDIVLCCILSVRSREHMTNWFHFAQENVI